SGAGLRPVTAGVSPANSWALSGPHIAKGTAQQTHEPDSTRLEHSPFFAFGCRRCEQEETEETEERRTKPLLFVGSCSTPGLRATNRRRILGLRASNRPFFCLGRPCFRSFRSFRSFGANTCTPVCASSPMRENR